ncbi:MAG: glycosyltransferase 87 family protein [Caldilineales bacterium]
MKHWRLLALMAAGLALRLALMPRPDPFDADLTTFWLPWMNYAGQHGLAQLYLHGEPVVNYPPFYMVLLTGVGKLYGALVPGFGYTPLQSVLIKLPAVIADLAVGAMLYVAALRVTSDKATNLSEASTNEPESGPGARPAGSSTALLAAGLWLLNPAVIYVSSFWAQVDAVHTMWMVAALLAALGKRWGWSGLLIGLGLLTKLQAVVILPLLILLAWWNGWRAVGRWSGGLAAVLAAGGLASLAAGVLAPVLDTYTNAVGFYPALSMNAYNPWFVLQFVSNEFLGRTLYDTARLAGPVTLRWVGMALLAGYGLAILWTLHRRWQPRTAGRSDWPAAGARLDTFFAAGLLVFGFFTLATEMHERYVLPALAFLALPAARGRQRLLAYLLLSGAVALNLLRVLPFAPAVYFTFERIPGDRVLIALASTALFIWWTLIYLRAGSTVATEKEENDGLATLSHGLQ